MCFFTYLRGKKQHFLRRVSALRSVSRGGTRRRVCVSRDVNRRVPCGRLVGDAQSSSASLRVRVKSRGGTRRCECAWRYVTDESPMGDSSAKCEVYVKVIIVIVGFTTLSFKMTMMSLPCYFSLTIVPDLSIVNHLPSFITLASSSLKASAY